MITELLIDKDKLNKSTLMHIGSVRNLQIGKTFVLFRNVGNIYKKIALNGRDYRLVNILSVTPKLNLSKISNAATFSTMHDSLFFGKETKKHYDFKKYIADNMLYSVWGRCHEYGWLYYEVTYQDIYTKDISTDIVYYASDSYDPCIESTKAVPDNYGDQYMVQESERFYASDMFEYDVCKKDNSDDIRIKEDLSIVEDTRHLLMTELADSMINNYRAFLAYSMSNNTKTINDNDTIDIDGVTWYNGFFNDPGGTKNRSYLFYDYIPHGWRLPTIAEVQAMLKKHPLLRKELPESYKQDNIGALRNNAGMQCYYSLYYFRFVSDLWVMVNDSNNYLDEKCYFPCELLSIDIKTHDVKSVPVQCNDCNNGLRPYIIMLVKMTDDEIKRQDAWAENVIENSFKYKTISEIYADFGVSDINDVESITFSITHTDDNSVKTYERKKYNANLQKVKDAIAAYIGNNDIQFADKIHVSFTGNNINGKIDFSSDTECDLPAFITKITPLLCNDLTYVNVCSIKRLLRERHYYHDVNINDIYDKYAANCMPINMYYYIKNALSVIGINHDSDNAHTAYISELQLHMKDGYDVLVKDIPIKYFNQSMLYMREINNIDNYTEDVRHFIDQMNKKNECDK